MADDVDLKAFLAETAPPKTAPKSDDVDLGAFLAETAPKPPRAKMSAGEAFGHGAGQGLSLGFADEGASAIGATRDVVMAAIGARGDISWQDAYNSYIDKMRTKMVDTPMADQPRANIAGNVVGSLALAVPGAAGAAVRGGATVAKVAAAEAPGLLARGGKLALRGAVLGGTVGAGTSEAKLTADDASGKWNPDVIGLGKDVAVGAGTGVASELGIAALAKGAKALTPTALRNRSNIAAAKAAGAMGSDLKKAGPELTQRMGEEIHQAGLKVFDSIEDVGAKIAARKEAAGKAIGVALDSVDDLVARAKAAVDAGDMPPQAKENLKRAIEERFQFNMKRIGEKIEADLIAPNTKNPLLKVERAQLQSIADDFKAGGSASMREGNVIKGTQGRKTNFNSETVPQTFKQEVYGIIKGELDEIVGKTGNLEQGVAALEGKTVGKLASPDARNASVSKAYSDAKKSYGALAHAEDINYARQGSAAGNRSISLTDTIAGAAGLAHGGPVAAGALGALNKVVRTYGASVQAVGTRAMANLFEKAPTALGKFYPVLQAAAGNGVAALAATHAKLLKDPNYQRILENADKAQAIDRRVGGTK